MKAPTVWHICIVENGQLRELIQKDNFFRKGQPVEVVQIVNNELIIVYKNQRLPQFRIPVFDIRRGTYEDFCKVNYKGIVWSLSCYFRELSAICIS